MPIQPTKPDSILALSANQARQLDADGQLLLPDGLFVRGVPNQAVEGFLAAYNREVTDPGRGLVYVGQYHTGSHAGTWIYATLAKSDEDRYKFTLYYNADWESLVNEHWHVQ